MLTIQLMNRGRLESSPEYEKCYAMIGEIREEMGERVLTDGDEEQITSTCTVFAESEIISLIAHGVPVAPILRSLHRSLVQRIVAMIRIVDLHPPLMLSGGVVLNPAVHQMLEEETGEQAILPAHPQLTGAFGAALLALEARKTEEVA